MTRESFAGWPRAERIGVWILLLVGFACAVPVVWRAGQWAARMVLGE